MPFEKKFTQKISKFVRKGIAGKSLPEKNGGVEKLITRKKVCSSNSITGKESVFQISLPEEKVAFKYHYRKKKWLSNIIPEKNLDFKNHYQKLDFCEVQQPLQQAALYIIAHLEFHLDI